MFKVLKIDGGNIVTDKGCVAIGPFSYADGGKSKPVDNETYLAMRDGFLALPELLMACQHAEAFIQNERDMFIDNYTVPGSGGDTSTLDEFEADELAMIDATLAMLRGAIRKATPATVPFEEEATTPTKAAPTKYLIEYRGKGRIVEVPLGTSSDDYGKLQRAFAIEAGWKESRDKLYDGYADMWRLDEHYKHDGVYWNEELAGPGGMSYIVFQLPNNTDEQVAATVSKLRRDHDVVRLSVHKLTFI